MKSILCCSLLLSLSTTTTLAFTATPLTSHSSNSCRQRNSFFAESKEESVVVPLGEEPSAAITDGEDIVGEFEGRKSAKAKRGKRKSGQIAAAKQELKRAASLAPEEVYYEGPPALSETFLPTLSIVTVLGIVPALASWSRQAWVRYRITTRRIRVQSGVGGKDMAEIVYPDITEIRTVRRLFGDFDMALSLRDGAKFEMRNVPNYEETIDFILKQVDSSVADLYREQGDVTNSRPKTQS